MCGLRSAFNVLLNAANTHSLLDISLRFSSAEGSFSSASSYFAQCSVKQDPFRSISEAFDGDTNIMIHGIISFIKENKDCRALSCNSDSCIS